VQGFRNTIAGEFSGWVRRHFLAGRGRRRASVAPIKTPEWRAGGEKFARKQFFTIYFLIIEIS